MQGFRYEANKGEHLKDAEFFRSVLDSSEMKAEEMSKKLLRDFFDEECAELGEIGPCYCFLSNDKKLIELSPEDDDEEKIRIEEENRLGALYNRFRDSFRKEGSGVNINEEIKKDLFLSLDQLKP